MKANKLWSIFMMIVMTLSVTVTLSSCGPDDDNEITKQDQNNNQGTTTVTLSCPDSQHPHAIDLGLPSGTKWACCNVGAKSRSDKGSYFAWGELYPKNSYDWDNYKFSDYVVNGRGYLNKYCFTSLHGIVDNRKTLLPEDDVATQKWGRKWCMPTIEDIDEIIEKCAWKHATMSGVKGRMVVGPNGNTIFLPFSGYVTGSLDIRDSNYGYYWSSTVSLSLVADVMYFNDDTAKGTSEFGRSTGLVIRPVCK